MAKVARILALVLQLGVTLAACGGSGVGVEVEFDPALCLLRDDLPVVELAEISSSSHALRLSGFYSNAVLSRISSLRLARSSDKDGPARVPYLIRPQRVSLVLEPRLSRISGQARIELVAQGAPLEQARFVLDAATLDVVGDAIGFEYQDRVVTITPDTPLQAGEILEVTLIWQDESVEQVVDLFPEGGGSVLANLISEQSTFFTHGYLFWPVPLGDIDYAALEFEVTFPSEKTLVMSGERFSEQDNGDGTRTEIWIQPQPHDGALGLVLSSFERVEGNCGDSVLEIYAIPGMSIDDFPIDPETYLAVVSSLCNKYQEWFQESSFSTVRFAGVDERFINGYAAPGLIIVPNYIWDDDGTGSFTERNFYLAHELAHQWWGNDVFIGDIRDAWLVEGMADYVAAEAVAETEGEEAGRFIWLWEVEPYLSWLRDGGQDHPVVPEVGTQMEPLVYYVKGAWVLRMLETVMGAEGMGELLRQFRLDHPFSVATTDEFVALAEETAGEDLGWFFEQWLSGTGVMSLDVSGKKVAGGVEVSLSQQAAWSDSPERYYRMPVTIQARRGQASATETFELDGQSGRFLVEIE